MSYDLWIDFNARESGGLTPTLAEYARPGLKLRKGAYVVVGSEDSEPAVGEIAEVADDGVVLVRVLPGPASDHLDLVTRG